MLLLSINPYVLEQLIHDVLMHSQPWKPSFPVRLNRSPIQIHHSSREGRGKEAADEDRKEAWRHVDGGHQQRLCFLLVQVSLPVAILTVKPRGLNKPQASPK